ncbi:MAG TPA: DUF4476 domain-containing protein [Bacteroidia bacterium]|jgi:hypothetical protein|nr:DUF4476 domain-containing protein [Bacteroidia bacterium]
MLKQYFAVLLTFSFGIAAAQNNLIVLTEKGSLFTLYVNDIKINDSIQSEVTAVKLFDDTCTVKIQFADKNISTFGAKIFLTVSGKTVSKREFTYSLSEEKGKRKLNFISVNYIQSDTTAKQQAPELKIKKIFTDLEKQRQEQNKLNEIYPPPFTCKNVISDSLLQAQLKLLRDEHFEISRMKDGKWFVSNYCINAKQLTLLLDVFDRRDSKVKIAEFAFDYIEDPHNFLETVKNVGYDTEKKELADFYHKRIEK